MKTLMPLDRPAVPPSRGIRVSCIRTAIPEPSAEVGARNDSTVGDWKLSERGVIAYSAHTSKMSWLVDMCTYRRLTHSVHVKRDLLRLA